MHSTRWTEQKIARRLELVETMVYRQRAPLPPFRHRVLAGPEESPPMAQDWDDSEWGEILPRSYWGEWRQDFALRTTFQVPDTWEPHIPIALHLPLGDAGDFVHPEALVYVDGEPLAGCDRYHQELRLPDGYRDGRPHHLALHGWTGLGGWPGGEPGTQLLMRPCTVVQPDEATRTLVTAARVALGVATAWGEEQPAKNHLLDALDAAFRLLDLREPLGEAFYASVPAALDMLQKGIAQAGPPLAVEIHAVGHAHIDLAWLWTVGQTRRKAGRTFHTVLRLMEQFPDYHFTQSQPWLYEAVRQDYPALFEAIRARVAEGRWEPIGGMWVEADCNLSGAESLARQLLLGRSYFREQFGAEAESPVLWLPDVFGYAWNLPQLMKQAGLDYFFTIKLSWNQYNRLPHDSFWWQGLDGTRVLTHFSPTPEIGRTQTTYNAIVTPEQVLGTWRNTRQKEAALPMLLAYGYGDGGGGPTREMLENAQSLGNFPASPRVQLGRAGDFFRALERAGGDQLPVWDGELYLEFHRGTYTTQARTKQANRRNEFLLHDAEFLAALAAQVNPTYAYPTAALREAWQIVCLNQFHDILPGSSIQEVYTENLQQHAEVQATVGALRDTALDALAPALGGAWLLVNPTSFARSELAQWEGELASGQRLVRGNGSPVRTQPTEGGTLLDVGTLPPYSVTALRVAEGEEPPAPTTLSASPTHLENHLLRVEFNEAGDIVRLFDKTVGREVLPEGALANQFQAFEDRPLRWDAWDVDIFYDDKCWLAEPATRIQVTEMGPLRATVEIERPLLNSWITQRISLAHDSACVLFDTTLAWQERHVLLKVAFPVDILAPAATYEIQWGTVQRPTHHNTSWDWARFESCAQKWVDLSEGNYGVSLLNDGKYGHDIHQNVLRLSLLRSPTWPDPEADQGTHRFRYALLPHTGGWDERTVAAAYALNDPLIVHSLPTSWEDAGDTLSLFYVAPANAVIETVKGAEDGNGLIVRLYESQRKRGPITLTTGLPLAGVWETNLLEENQQPLPHDKHEVTFGLKPYQIRTLRVVFEREQGREMRRRHH